MATELLAPTTSALPSRIIKVPPGEEATFIMRAAAGLTAAEYGDVQISHDGGLTFQDLWSKDVQLRLSDTNVAETVYGPGVFIVNKEATTNATGIYLSSLIWFDDTKVRGTL